MACVTLEKIEEVWGKCSTFKTSNTTLSPQSRAELLELCSKIYGKVENTNNEFIAWVIKGYIAELMGFEINWASAAASTTLLLVSRLEGELLKRDLTLEEAVALKHLEPYAIAKPSVSHSKANARTSGLGSESVEAKLFSGKFKPAGIPPVLVAEVLQAEEVLAVEGELLTNTESKERFLNASKTSIAERIIGFKFGMDDRNADAEESAENVKVVEEGLKQIRLLISALEMNVQQFRDNLDEGNDQFIVVLQKLEKLRLEQEVQSKKLEFANLSLKDCQRKAKKAGELYTDASLDMWKFEADITVVKRELEEVQRYKNAVADQIHMMQQGGGVTCWPKPCLHPHLPNEVGGVFELEACSFCNQWYTSFDVVMASCRHFYHPFCIAKVVETQNACVICKKTFHPAWWRSFGFRSRESDVQDAVVKSSLARSMEELSDTLKDSFGFPIPEWSQSRGKQSNRESSGSIYQVPAGVPCISGSKLKDAAPSNGDNLQPETKVGPNGDCVDEVDSPAKEAAGGTNDDAINPDLATMLAPKNIDALLCPSEEAAQICTPLDPGSTALEDMAIATSPTSLADASPASPAEGTSAARYSFNVKRSCNPSIDDYSTRKKITKSCASNQSIDVYKATRLSRQSPSKNGSSHRHECRKGDVVPEIIGLQVETTQKVVTRSRVKNK